MATTGPIERLEEPIPVRNVSDIAIKIVDRRNFRDITEIKSVKSSDSGP